MLSQQFDELDADGSGELDDKDIEVLTKRIGLANAAGGQSQGGSAANTPQAGRRSLSSFKVAGLTMKAVGVMTKFARDKRRESNLLANKLRDAELKKIDYVTSKLLAEALTAGGNSILRGKEMPRTSTAYSEGRRRCMSRSCGTCKAAAMT